jgi:hypothetical protein
LQVPPLLRIFVNTRLLEYCTIDKNYRTTLEATPLDYPELPPINIALIGTEALEYNFRPDDLLPWTPEAPESLVIESTVRTYYPRGFKQGDLFN